MLHEEAEGYPWMKISDYCRYDGDGRTPFVGLTDSAPQIDIRPEGVVREGQCEERGEVFVTGAFGVLVLALGLLRVCA